MTLKVSCVSFPRAPVGVMDVRPVELTAMRVNTKTRGTAIAPISQWTLKKRCPKNTVRPPITGMPTTNTHMGSSMCSRISFLPEVFLNNPEKAFTMSPGFEKNEYRDDVVISATPPHRAHMVMCLNPVPSMIPF